MASQTGRRKRSFTILAIGLLLELIGIYLLASRRVAVPVGMLFVIVGLFAVVLGGRSRRSDSATDAKG